MDYGAKWGGYCADMTRTVAVGGLNAEMERVYDTVLRPQLACCKAIKAGMTGREVDAIAREIIDGAGYAGRFGHGLGHSLGIEIHEDPRCSPRDDTVLRDVYKRQPPSCRACRPKNPKPQCSNLPVRILSLIHI